MAIHPLKWNSTPCPAGGRLTLPYGFSRFLLLCSPGPSWHFWIACCVHQSWAPHVQSSVFQMQNGAKETYNFCWGPCAGILAQAMCGLFQVFCHEVRCWGNWWCRRTGFLFCQKWQMDIVCPFACLKGARQNTPGGLFLYQMPMGNTSGGLDIAGKSKAREESMIAAINNAWILSQ